MRAISTYTAYCNWVFNWSWYKLLPDGNARGEETKHIPIAMLSNFGQNELVQDAINNGALDYILKYQIEPQDLVNKIKELYKQVPPQVSVPASV